MIWINFESVVYEAVQQMILLKVQYIHEIKFMIRSSDSNVCEHVMMTYEAFISGEENLYKYLHKLLGFCFNSDVLRID